MAVTMESATTSFDIGRQLELVARWAIPLRRGRVARASVTKYEGMP